MRQPFSIFTIVALGVSTAAVFWQELAADANPNAGAADSGSPGASNLENASGDVLLDTAAAALRSKANLSARVRFRIDLVGHQLFGSGKYLQKGRAPQLKSRLELAAQTSIGKMTLHHVNDGIHWWRYQDYGQQAEFSYVNLESLRDQLTRPKHQAAGRPYSDLALGGLPRLLASLRNRFQLTNAVQVHRGGQLMWRVGGAWRGDPVLAASVAADAQTRRKFSHVPDSVVIYFDASTLFPVRFEFYRQVGDATPKLLVAMELYEVQFEVTIDDRQFTQPSEMIPKDVTDEFLGQIQISESGNPGE